MRAYNVYKDLSNRVTPARGQVITRDRVQSGPFAIVPSATDAFILGAGSKIIFGEKNWGVSIIYDLSFRTINRIGPNNIVTCKIQFQEGLPISYNTEVLSLGDTIQELKYKDDASWPSPKNVESMTFLIAAVYEYNTNLRNIYGESIADGPPRQNGDELEGSYSAIRATFNAIRIVQTCYGFMLVPTTTF